jgi:hypothetical protein
VVLLVRPPVLPAPRVRPAFPAPARRLTGALLRHHLARRGPPVRLA